MLSPGYLALCAAAAVTLQAQTLTTLFSFDFADGAYPEAALIQGTDGNFYGTTPYGGAHGPDYGTIFRIVPSGTLTTLYSFCAQTGCTDGYMPYGALVQATNGDFYGTTYEGGANDWGTVFKVTRAGTLTTLHNFCSEAKCTDGGQPQAGLIQAINGNLYGTTTIGGPNGGGTIFMITPSGTLKTLYGFCAQSNCADGKSPEAGLIQATSGDFYGTTPSGGANSGGTVFKVTPGGALTTLYSFCSQNAGQPCSDGEEPFGELVQAINGNLYGTTYVGGGGGEGTIFSITPSGALTTLYSFCSPSGCTAGYQPLSGLVQATDGNLYGTASGTNSGGGAVFEINQSGAVSALYSFPCCASPFAALVQATDGNFYGTTHSGGALNYGTVFSLSVGLGPFVKAQPSAAKVSGVVEILGTNLTGATGVTFNGIPAVFNVASSSLITTNVPAGATTGTVQVVTPSATLSSNVPFQVLP